MKTEPVRIYLIPLSIGFAGMITSVAIDYLFKKYFGVAGLSHGFVFSFPWILATIAGAGYAYKQGRKTADSASVL